jgi:hypothetical protein
MSTATTIQTHIAYQVMDDQNLGIAVSDLMEVSDAVKSVDDNVEARAAKNVEIPSTKNRPTVAPALSLDDFGGRSDALGG